LGDYSNAKAKPEEGFYHGQMSKEGKKHGCGTCIGRTEEFTKEIGKTAGRKGLGANAIRMATSMKGNGQIERQTENAFAPNPTAQSTWAIVSTTSKLEKAFPRSTKALSSKMNTTKEKHGIGILRLPGGSQFTGMFHKNKMQGKGISEWKDGRVYDGDWKENKMHGTGFPTWADGS
jgi:hypothetical protein